MKCEWVRENIVLHVYGELADDARHELEQHIARCADCALELRAEQNFHELLSQDRVEEPSPNLLTSSRMRLQESLETTQQGAWWHRLAFDPANWLRQIRFSPALASAILILGFAGGMGTAFRMIPRGPQGPGAGHGPTEGQASISGIEAITQAPGSNQVTI
jgi:anti-sigma factor RsiW